MRYKLKIFFSWYYQKINNAAHNSINRLIFVSRTFIISCIYYSQTTSSRYIVILASAINVPKLPVYAPKWQKNAFLSPTVFWRPIATQPPWVSSSTLYRLKVDSVSYISAADSRPLCVYLLSNFCGGLRKMHNRRRRVRIDPSGSSEVDDFRVSWKGLCDFLLVINSNLSSYLSPFLRYDDLSVENRQFSHPTSVRPRIWKCSLCTRSLKFCMRRAKTLG